MDDYSPISMISGCRALVKRDLLLVLYRRSEALNPVLFALMVSSLFPFALGAEPNQLAPLASGIVLVTILLANLLTLDNIFRSDFEDGSLEQLMLSSQPLALLVGCKIFVHWLTSALPLVLIAPLLAMFLHLPIKILPILLIVLLLATFLLSLIGAVCVSLTLSLRRSGMLLTLLVLPLYIPILIFAAGACNAAQSGLPFVAPILWLSAGLTCAVVAAPLMCAATLKISLV